MAINNPILSQAFASLGGEELLLGYREYDVISASYVDANTYTKMLYRNQIFYITGIQYGYMITKIGFAMAQNPLILDPMSFTTPRQVGGQWTASFQVMKGGPVRVDVYGSDYNDTWDQFIIAYVNTVTAR